METGWRRVLGIILAIAIPVYLFGVMVNVPFTEREVSLREAVVSMDWRKLGEPHFGSELFQSFLISGLLIPVAMRIKRRLFRLVLLAGAFIAPLWIISPEFYFVPFAAPLLVAGMLAGVADGEFYGEDMPRSAAVGLLMLGALAGFLRDAWLVWKLRPRQETGRSFRSARVDR